MTEIPGALPAGEGGGVDRALTGILGIDDVLAGGLPRNRLYLVEGMPGTGKTTLALQFLLEGRRLGERGMYVTLSETADELRASAATPRLVARRHLRGRAGARGRPWLRAGADPAPPGRVRARGDHRAHPGEGRAGASRRGSSSTACRSCACWRRPRCATAGRSSRSSTASPATAAPCCCSTTRPPSRATCSCTASPTA